jgi:tetratricopeptide (TPR) repeat protein
MIDPHFDAALRLRIAVYSRLKKVNEALADMDELIRLHPADARLLAGHGLVLVGVKQRDQGLSEIERAVVIDPKNAYAYFARGFVKRISGKPTEALSDLDLSISINPKEASTFVQRGMTYLALSEVDKALLDFDKALALNQLDDNARAARGLALLSKGNTAEGLPDINRVLERNPKNELALLGRGLELLTSGQSDRAIVALNQLIEGPVDDDITPRVLRARAYLIRNETANAMLDLNYILNVRPGNGEVLILRGIASSAMHEYDKALADLNQGLGKLENVEGYFARAKIYQLKNDVPHATADFLRAAELKPKGLFDLLAQAESRKRVQQLSKRLPCGSSGRAESDGSCL